MNEETYKPVDSKGDYSKCYESALHFLEFRPRSEAEVRRHLLVNRKFDELSVDQAIDKLKLMGLIDDKAFADAWKNNRIRHKPKSRLMIKRELIQKGISSEIIAEVTDGISDEENAFTAGIKKARLLREFDYPLFSKRLAAYLARRGYNSEIIHSTVDKLWQYICDLPE